MCRPDPTNSGSIPVRFQFRFIDEPLTEKELERLRQSVNRQSPYGQTEWQIKVAQELGLESTLRPRGRLKKGEEDEKK